MVNWKYELSFPMFIHQDRTSLCVQLLFFVLLYHINIELLFLNGLFYFPNDFCVKSFRCSILTPSCNVSCFVIKEDSLAGYLSFSVCFLLTMQMANYVQTCGPKRAPCCAVRRQPAHTERVGGCGTVFAFLWFSCEGKVGPFQVCFLLVGGNRRRQQRIMVPSPPSPLAPPLSALCVLTDFAT